MSFVELSAQSNFSFLTGGSHPEEYMRRSADLGLAALAIADDNSVSGIVRAHLEAREIARDAKHATTPRLIPATKIVLSATALAPPRCQLIVLRGDVCVDCCLWDDCGRLKVAVIWACQMCWSGAQG